MEEKAKVYWCDFRAVPGTNLLEKLKRLMRHAGIETIDFDKKMAAIKIHFGEPGNLSYLRPNYAKAVADVVKELGGMPFLTDCNTLYVGRRKNALDHLETAYENGFSPFSTGCHVLIGDGLKGTDDIEVPVRNGELCKTAKIGKAIMDADVFISLSHFKGHECTGFGGALKNIGMGCGSRAGKMEQHNSGKPSVDTKLCRGCHVCEKNCAQDAIYFDENCHAHIDHERCVGCGRCLGSCNFDAIYNENSSANDDLNRKIAEYSMAVVDGRDNFHINLVMDVSPYCDCHPENDLPIIPDVGMFASFDPVALDQACADMCNKMDVTNGSLLDEHIHAHDFKDHHDHFTNVSPQTDWKVCLEHAEKIGLGTRNYELIKVQ
ncbi:DUF362 domain-containing protein [Amedibacterium intestinale]|jgi:hypothetical protein|uniref:DUF362 domain-containing protein n=1 Tax=Amedibacterium intestinale TaxID=2583452 RepID=UPI000E4EEDD7|nr:DUF362 domain-containing protein [Amedibacterium intestinale]RHO28916.1 DUF362 domain-containing protein [Erysipelotrichaceae bacterium AM17-60]